MYLQSPLDMHLHLRDKESLKILTPLSARDFAAAVIMPNLLPPIRTLKALLEYKKNIEEAAKPHIFTPLMTLFYQNYEPSFLEKAREHIFAIKLYPAGITTNSQEGLKSFDIKAMSPTLEAMSELGIPLLVHGESCDFVMDREAGFAPIYSLLASSFTKLKIVMEHISTKSLANLLLEHENLYATITLHHLLITLDDVLGANLNPHLFCKPIAKRPKDREALLELALNAHPKVMFGSDSAPHSKEAKLECGCAGVFSAPLCLAMLYELFKSHKKEAKLQGFISDNAMKIHNLNIAKKKIFIEEESWEIPKDYAGFIPFMAGECLKYKSKACI